MFGYAIFTKKCLNANNPSPIESTVVRVTSQQPSTVLEIKKKRVRRHRNGMGASGTAD